MPTWFVDLFAILFGAVAGSFLNVVIVRLPRSESIAFPGSHCVRCGAPIRWYDNIPVLSYVLLRGRCRVCRAPFSMRYAIVELLGAAAALAVVTVFGATLTALGFYVFLWLLLGISAIDLEHWIIPHELSWSGIAIGLLFSLVSPRTALRSALTAAAIGWAIFTVMSWAGEKIFKKEALGLGDRWLLAMICAFLGLPAILPVILFAALQGAIVGVLLIAIGKAQTGQRAPNPEPPGGGAGDEDDWVPPKNALPFGPFLSLAGAEWLFFGPPLWAWYVGEIGKALG